MRATTLLLVLAGLLAPDGGQVRIAGFDPVTQPFEVRRSIGWMPDFFGVYEGLTALEYLELFGAAYRLPREVRSERARELLGLVGLGDLGAAQIATLSRGQKQRLGFARAIVHRPQVLLLDEPASGLDPRARVELRDLVRRQRDEGACVLVSSHILSELEEMSDSAVFVERGRATGEYAISRAGAAEPDLRPWRIRALDAGALAQALTHAGYEPQRGPDGSATVQVAGETAAAEILGRLVADGVRVIEAGPETGGLERAFLASGSADASVGRSR